VDVSGALGAAAVQSGYGVVTRLVLLAGSVFELLNAGMLVPNESARKKKAEHDHESF